MQNNKRKTNKQRATDRATAFGDISSFTLKGHYKPLSELSDLERKAVTLIVKNFKFFTEADESEIRKEVNKIHLKPSYSQIASMFNEQGFKTSRGNEWSGRTVSRLMKKIGGVENEKIERAKQWENSRRTRVQKYNEFAIQIYNDELRTIDLNQKHHIIANELNKRGVTTRKGGKWGNVAVKRLLTRLNDLKIL